MTSRRLSFAEVLEAACKAVPRLWNQDGKLNLTAVARYCEERGFRVTQPTLYRHYHARGKATRELNKNTLGALSEVFHVPIWLWRGEPMGAEMEKTLERVSLSDLLVAERISRLPAKARQNILEQIEEVLDREERLKQAINQGNVTPIDRHKR